MENRIKKAFSCAMVNDFILNTQLVETHTPRMGDVGIFRIAQEEGRYLKDEHGSNHYLFENDLIMAAFGNRYATNQFEAYVPDAPVKFTHLIGRGGLVGDLKSVNSKFKGKETLVELVGYATDASGYVINTIKHSKLRPFNPSKIKSKIILSLGASMDSGKTTTAAYICGGMKRKNRNTAYIKLTGTVFPKDCRYVFDRGASYTSDFSALGYPSTFLLGTSELLDIYQTLIEEVQTAINPEFIVVEIADGILQRETCALLKSKIFMNTVDEVVLSSVNSLDAIASSNILNSWNIYPAALSGLVTASELLIKELRRETNIPILGLDELLAGKLLNHLETPTSHHIPLMATSA